MRELIRKKVDLRSMLDPRSEWPHDIADNLMMLAADCTNYDSHKRPPMATVGSGLFCCVDVIVRLCFVCYCNRSCQSWRYC